MSGKGLTCNKLVISYTHHHRVTLNKTKEVFDYYTLYKSKRINCKCIEETTSKISV